MACTSPDASSRDDVALREAHIAERTDARCLAQTLVWFRRTYLLAPFGIVLFILGVQQGAPIWSVAWFVAWAAHQAAVYRLAVRLQAHPTATAAAGLALTTRAFAIAGVLTAAVFPLFFVMGASTSELLLVTLLACVTAGPVMISSAGVARAYAAYTAPSYAVLIAAWLWRGGLAGYALALIFAGSFPFAMAAVRMHRQTLEELVRLLDKNETLAEALARERDRAEAASESKTRFFAAASHDLRQPLHALSINATTLDLLARRSTDPVLKELNHGIGSALRQSRSLLDGLLDISRLDAHAVQTRMAAHDVAAILTAVRDEYAALAAQRGLAFELTLAHDLPAVLTDSDQLMRILGNLVDNAIKFTREGHVRLSAGPDASDRVLIQVSDTGPGITAGEHEHVFEEFYQVGNASRDRSKGLGLGLAIVRRTAALLEIQLSLVSAPSRGTTFELRLPRAPADAVAKTALAASSVNTIVLSVLVVDDEPEVLASMCSYLRQIGWSARGVASGRQAQQALADGFRADVLAVDYRLRGETGLQVIEQLREREPGLPAVIVTGDTSPMLLREFTGLAASVVNKPVDGEQLARALAEAVGA
jgi:signal transduction histidine kinase